MYVLLFFFNQFSEEKNASLGLFFCHRRAKFFQLFFSFKSQFPLLTAVKEDISMVLGYFYGVWIFLWCWFSKWSVMLQHVLRVQILSSYKYLKCYRKFTFNVLTYVHCTKVGRIHMT